MTKEAMKLALEVLEYIYEGANNQGTHTGISWRCVSNKAEPVITALREALTSVPDWASEAIEQSAQQEPEWYHFVRYGEDCFVPYSGQAPEKATPLYTSPQRTWVGLTTADRKEIERQSVYVEGAIRLTEAKLKEKNT